MVIFRRPDGKPGYHQADGVDDAVRFVEMLRNQEKVTDARIFRMEEVPIEFRAYYGGEGGGEEEAEAPAPTPAPANGTANGATDVPPLQPTAPAPPAAPADALDPMPVEVGAGKGRRFGRN
jgi:hypothetical protein